jgi:hypothetical protein
MRVENLTVISVSSLLTSVPKEYSTTLVVVGLADCKACEMLKRALARLSKEKELAPRVFVAILSISELDELETLGLNISAFPTIIGFKGGKICFGWQGFATMAPTEITDAIVRDVIKSSQLVEVEVGKD